MAEPLLQIDALTHRFPSHENNHDMAALDAVSLTIARGETLALVGPSGSGKSTLARVLLRLLTAETGQIRFAGEDWLALKGRQLRKRRALMQMVFQEPLSAFNPRARIADLLDEPLRIHRIASRAERPDHIAQLLERVGLSADLSGRMVHEVSGGQRQRVAIARAIATKPLLIVLDEAVSALDVTVRAHILNLLEELQRSDGTSYLFITHDLAVARRLAQRIAVIDQGRIVEIGTAHDLIASPQAPVTRALIAAAPRLVV